jgi:alkanesulfonate monooxygenase SsuD/methylene tetrahydromethanopterin reductase-like flavin-dependent oxidoreductase (luciferase family)
LGSSCSARIVAALVAQYADVWNRNGIPSAPDELELKIDMLTRHCEAVGRDPTEIRKTGVAMANSPLLVVANSLRLKRFDD